jgi:hypothetical protein
MRKTGVVDLSWKLEREEREEEWEEVVVVMVVLSPNNAIILVFVGRSSRCSRPGGIQFLRLCLLNLPETQSNA